MPHESILCDLIASPYNFGSVVWYMKNVSLWAPVVQHVNREHETAIRDEPWRASDIAKGRALSPARRRKEIDTLPRKTRKAGIAKLKMARTESV
jgi:hypothetical protein